MEITFRSILIVLALIAHLFSSVGLSADLLNAIRDGDIKAALSVMDGKTTVQLNTLIHGQAPIHIAVEQDLAEIVFALVDHGASINLPTNDGVLPAQIAYQLPNKKLYDLLRKAGAYRAPAALADKASSINFATLLSNDDARKIFPYMYPLFFSDQEAFQLLNNLFDQDDLLESHVLEMIESIIDEDFPNGLPSMAARKVLEVLFSKLPLAQEAQKKMEDKIQMRIYRLPLSNSQSANKTISFGEKKKMFMAMDNKILAKALTTQEAALMAKITPEQIALWFKHHHLAESINDYAAFGNQMKMTFALFIASTDMRRDRNAIAIKLIDLAERMLKLKNFPGMQAILGALENPSVKRIIDLNSKAKKRIAKLSDILSPNGNFSAYNAHMSTSAKVPAIPLIGIVFRNILHASETMPKPISTEWLIDIASFLKTQTENGRTAHAHFASMYREHDLPLIDNDSEITDDIIDAFAMSQEPDLFALYQGSKKQKVAIRKAYGPQLVKCIHHLQLPNIVSLQLLHAGIWSGEKLKDHLSLAPSIEKQIDLLMNLGLKRPDAVLIRFHFDANSLFEI